MVLSRSGLLLWGLSLVAGCGGDPVMRLITLTAQPTLASGESTLRGDLLHVYTCGLEPLVETSQYVAWIVMGGQATVLGRLAPTVNPTVFAVSSPLDPATPADVLVTEETGRSTYPDSPSPLVRLSGPVGGNLTYAPLCGSCLAGVTGTAELRDDQITVSAMQSPPLPAGLLYGVWATWTTVIATSGDSMPGMSMVMDPGTPVPLDAGHTTTAPATTGTCSYNAQGTESTSAAVERLLLGMLDDIGMLTTDAPRSLTTVDEIVLTVESARAAADTMSAVVAMRGQITLPVTAETAAPHMH